ncbi:MAG: DUF4337 domain-containing protein [Sphingomonadaceae bacterium]|nr:DUF4337 domain-containing protein [Sphingomonadaceae bacterium]
MSEGIEAPEGGNRRLNRMVAVTVVILSVAMAVGKIKDDNIVQAMQADQASKIDLWSEYQSTRIKAHDQRIAATLLGQSPTGAGAAAAAQKESARYDGESAGLKRQAQDAQHDYDVQGRRDDQFDLSDGFMSIALAVVAISALIEQFWLLAVGWVSGGFGLLFLVAGFESLAIHPDALVAFLS